MVCWCAKNKIAVILCFKTKEQSFLQFVTIVFALVNKVSHINRTMLCSLSFKNCLKSFFVTVNNDFMKLSKVPFTSATVLVKCCNQSIRHTVFAIIEVKRPATTLADWQELWSDEKLCSFRTAIYYFQQLLTMLYSDTLYVAGYIWTATVACVEFDSRRRSKMVSVKSNDTHALRFRHFSGVQNGSAVFSVMYDPLLILT